MWYVIQTLTGREEEVVRMVKKILPQNTYAGCFVAYYERIWRKQQQSLVHVERLFPGYVFIETEDPEEVYRCLKGVPAMTKLVSDGMFTFLPLERGEEDFLRDLLGDAHIVRLSYVEKDSRGHVFRVSGPLKKYLGQVVRYQYKKRYALIGVQLLGETKLAALGILLREDVRQELQYGKVEAPSVMPGVYQAEQPEKDPGFAVGDRVTVTSGELEGMTGVIWKVKKNTVDVGIRLFGQDMAMEMPIGVLCASAV